MSLKMLQHNSSNRQGFALVMLAALLVVAGIATSVFLMSQEQERLLGPKQKTNEKLEAIATALMAYQRQHHALPCPANLGVAVETANYGAPVATCTSAPARNIMAADPDGSVHIGMVPTRALGISTDAAADAWGNRILYAASVDLTDSLNFTNGTGIITISDGTGDLTTRAAFVVLSHGENGAGAVTVKSDASGAPITRDPTCTKAQRDAQNCPSNIAAATQVSFLKTSYNMESGADYFDDLLIYANVDEQAKTQNRSCNAVQSLWFVGNDICRGPIVTMTHGEQTANVVATIGTGQADITCNNGKLIYTGVSCAP